MVHFQRKILTNGLRVLVHEDRSTPLVAVNVAYQVGSRDEQADRTGFAHLFEHLMFSGSRNIPDFDEPLQGAGGENNAYTTNDYTTFFNILPAANLETALWLESDRMLSLRINHRSLDIQRRVVVEEFKETCLNEPYGDSWHHLSEMMYSVHPYRWPVIGLTPAHVEAATINEVRAFYRQWYGPNNAVLSIAGNVDAEEAIALCERWFADIPARPTPVRQLPADPPRRGAQHKLVAAAVPVPAFYMAFRMPARLDKAFYPVDLLSDILAQGQSSRLYTRILKERQLCSSIDCYVTGNTDPGLLVIEGRPSEGIQPEQVVEAVWKELNQLKQAPVSDSELTKIQRKLESTVVFSETSVLNKAQNLGYYELLLQAELMNEEVAYYRHVSTPDLQNAANLLFGEDEYGLLLYAPET